MAALPILTRDHKTGSVFVEDRRPDGTIVVLVCAEGHDGSGVAAPSQTPEETKVVFPMHRELALRSGNRAVLGSHFVLTIETTDLPAGRLEFQIGRFLKQVEAAVEANEDAVHLDLDQAFEWGLRLTESDDDA